MDVEPVPGVGFLRADPAFLITAVARDVAAAFPHRFLASTVTRIVCPISPLVSL